MKIGKRYSLGQSPKVAAHAVEWRRVLGASPIDRREAACVKMCKILEIISDKKKRVRSRACALTRRTNGGYNYEDSDDANEISRDPRTKRLKTRRE